MKNSLLILILIILFGTEKTKGQYAPQLYYNTELLAQLSLNQGARVGSEESFKQSYEKQEEYHNSAKRKLTHIIALKNIVVSSLEKVDNALKRGKQLEQVYNTFHKLTENMRKMINLSLKNPQYAILIGRFYEKIYEHSFIAYNYITEKVLKEDNNHFVDSYDRQYFLDKIHTELSVLNGYCLFIINFLEKAKEKSYLKNVIEQNTTLSAWYSMDKNIIQQIINKSKYLPQ